MDLISIKDMLHDDFCIITTMQAFDETQIPRLLLQAFICGPGSTARQLVAVRLVQVEDLDEEGWLSPSPHHSARERWN